MIQANSSWRPTFFKRLAKDGDARSQNDLGFLYTVGQGVPQDFKTAAQWFSKAAKQVHPPALMHLADFYAAGRGVDQSEIEAHKFYSLASLLAKKSNLRHIAASRRDEVASRLTAAQLTTARKRACRWWRTYNFHMEDSGQQLPALLRKCGAE